MKLFHIEDKYILIYRFVIIVLLTLTLLVTLLGGILGSAHWAGLLSDANKIEKKPNVECAKCGKEFYKNESKKKNSKSGLFFCTRTCKDSAQTIGNGGIKKIMPPHYGNGNNY